MKVFILFVVAISAVASKECPCTRELMPVCGSDGVKYDNKCLMECQGATEVDMSECEPAGCACPYIFWQVCGKDGKTYDNECVMECAGVEMASEGKCGDSKRSATCKCTREYVPVCGTDGTTYDNDCLMRCAGVDLGSEGACVQKRDACNCPEQLELPVCGKDGITYNSMCELGCAGTQFRFLGRCPATPAPATTTEAVTEAPAICTADYTPVCGDDGVTYGNLCSLENTENVNLAYDGECNDDERRRRAVDTAGAACSCPDQIDMPVCGKDGITYNSMCALGCSKAEFRFLGSCPATPAPETTTAEVTTAAEAGTAPIVEVVACIGDDCSDDN